MSNDFDDFSLDDMDIEEFDNEEEPNNKSPSPDFEEDEENYEGIYQSETTFANASLSVMSEEEANQLRTYEQLENFNSVFPSDDAKETVHEEDVEYVTEQSLKEKAEKEEGEKKVRKLIVKTMEWVVETIKDGVSDIENTSSDKEKVREYKKEAVMPKIVHAKPLESKGGIKKILLFLAACACVGAFVGVKANSFYIFRKGDVKNAMSCAFSWIMEEGMPYNISPFYSDVFFTGFLIGFGLLGIIGLFIWLDSDAKKNSRVGHEHGKARLGTSKDFKTFKNKFMEK